MSTTISPTAAQAAIIKANSPADIGDAMKADPALMAAIMNAAGQLMGGNGKALLTSKTFWAALVPPVVGFMVGQFWPSIDQGTLWAVDSLIEMVAMVGARLITKEPITGVVSS